MAETGARKWLITATVILATMLELIDTSIVNVALPDMSGNLGATLEDAAWVITAYAIANVIIIPMTGFLAALFGRKKYYLGSIILFVVSSTFCGAARNIWVLVFFRFVQGIGGGGLLSTSQAYLFEAFPIEERGLASALFGLGVIVGPIVGPTVGGYLTDNFSWPWIFYVNVPVGIIALSSAYTFLTDGHTPKQDNVKIDWTGIFLLVVGIGSLQTVLERGETEDWFSKGYITFLAITSAIATGIFIWWELKIKNPVVNLRVLASRTLASAAFLTFCLGFTLFATIFLVPVFSQRLLGFTAMKSGMLQLPGALASIVMMPTIGKLLQRGVRPQILIIMGFVVISGFAMSLSNLTTEANYMNFFWPLIIRNTGTALLFIPLTILAISDLSPQDVPQGTAMNNMVRQLGGSFGIALINTYVDHRAASHRIQLISHVTLLEPATQLRLAQIQQSLISKGYSAYQASQSAYRALEGVVVKQTMAMSYLDAFKILAVLCWVCIPVVFTIRPKKKISGGMPVDAH